jgi:hypothetical protein
MTASPEPGVVNIDLDIRLRQGLDTLLSQLEQRVLVLHRDDDFARLESDGVGAGTLAKTFENLAGALEALPPEAKALWDGCAPRLDIGLRATPGVAGFTISREMVERLARRGVEIGLTVYPPEGADG